MNFSKGALQKKQEMVENHGIKMTAQ